MRFWRYIIFFVFFTGFCNPCISQVPGCTDSSAVNYNPSATTNDGSCLYNPVAVNPESTFVLPSVLHESSGLISWNNQVWTHNDDTDCNLYALDTLDGSIQSTLLLNAVVNTDWEEISHDSDFIYIGDFGNNANGNRTNLKILRISKSSVLSGQPEVDTISFSYSDQVDFTPSGINNTDFDCEAMIVTNDSIYLFTKQYLSFGTAVYALPKTPGVQTANYRYNYNIQGLITGATYLPGSRLIVLCGYTTLMQPFFYCLYDYDSTGFFSGNKRKIEIALPFHKVEGIATANGLKYYVSNEVFTQAPLIYNPQKLHIFDLRSYFENYLDTTTVIQEPELNTLQPVIFPNPTEEIIQVFIPDPKYALRYSLISESGKVVKSGTLMQGTNRIPTVNLPGNVYFLRIGNDFNYKISLVR